VEVKPPTGEPCAGEPHARFGGRGDANQCVIPTPIYLGAPVGLGNRESIKKLPTQPELFKWKKGGDFSVFGNKSGGLAS